MQKAVFPKIHNTERKTALRLSKNNRYANDLQLRFINEMAKTLIDSVVSLFWFSTLT